MKCVFAASASGSSSGALSGGDDSAGPQTGSIHQGKGGIGLDPVFQIWSNLWNLGLTGQEYLYYNLTQVQSSQDTVHESNLLLAKHMVSISND